MTPQELKTELEKIWQKGDCRFRLHRTIWLAKHTYGSVKECKGVYRIQGEIVNTRSKSNGENSEQVGRAESTGNDNNE